MKTFLSIGAGPGIGFATAERFAKENFQVILAARNAVRTHELAEKLKSKGYKAEVQKVDSGDPESVAALIAAGRHSCVGARVVRGLPGKRDSRRDGDGCYTGVAGFEGSRGGG
jgi:NAD(P)-dependent dehydrogenase (short-subunit alcohol dehydrogenase family)